MRNSLKSPGSVTALGRRLSTRVLKSASKDARSALIYGFASAAGLEFLEQVLHGLNLLDSGIQLGYFAFCDFHPPRRDGSGFAKTEEQSPDLIQTKTRFLGPPHHRQSVQHRRIVTPLTAHPVGRE